MTQNDEFSIGVLSERSGVNIETIRYYEKIGVMPKPARSAAGYRIYTTEHARRLHFVRRGRELGFSLDEDRVPQRGVASALAVPSGQSRERVSLPLAG